MRLVDLDRTEVTGKSLIEKALKDKELSEITFPCSEWKCVVVPNDGKPYVRMERK